MFPRPHCVCVRVLCARTRCSVSVSVGGRTFFCCSDSERESSERHSLKTRNSDRVCVGVIHRRSVRRTPHSSLSVRVCVRVFRPCVFCFFVTTEEENSCPCFLFCCCSRRERERASEVQLHYGCVCLIRQVLVRLPIDYRLIWVIRLVWTDVDVLPPELETNAVDQNNVWKCFCLSK